MSDKMRWRYGDTNPVVAAVDAATVVEIGDLLWQDVDDAKPVADVPVNVDEEGRSILSFALQRFTDNFLGVSAQRSRSGETAPIRVATTGVFEFDCPNDAYGLGELIGPRLIGSGTKLFNQEVEKVNTRACAIGRVAKRRNELESSVLVDIRSRVMGESI